MVCRLQYIESRALNFEIQEHVKEPCFFVDCGLLKCQDPGNLKAKITLILDRTKSFGYRNSGDTLLSFKETDDLVFWY